MSDALEGAADDDDAPVTAADELDDAAPDEPAVEDEAAAELDVVPAAGVPELQDASASNAVTATGMASRPRLRWVGLMGVPPLTVADSGDEPLQNGPYAPIRT